MKSVVTVKPLNVVTPKSLDTLYIIRSRDSLHSAVCYNKRKIVSLVDISDRIRTDSVPHNILRLDMLQLSVFPPIGFRSPKEHRDATTPVYFVEGAGLIKIGYASDPIARFGAMLTGCPIPLSLLASMPGGPTIENELHTYFSGDRAHGEWFHRSRELDAIIAGAPHQYGPDYRDRLPSLARRAGMLKIMRESERKRPYG